MYFHLFKNVMSRRWPSDCVWRHIPDEHVGVKWETLESCLSAKDSHQVSELALDSQSPAHESFGASIKRLFRVAEITECRSQELCLSQVADMLAGMGAFSRERFAEYRAWKRNFGYSETLFETPRPDVTSGQFEKFQVLSHFESRIARLALPVALDQTGGLRLWIQALRSTSGSTNRSLALTRLGRKVRAGAYGSQMIYNKSLQLTPWAVCRTARLCRGTVGGWLRAAGLLSSMFCRLKPFSAVLSTHRARRN